MVFIVNKPRAIACAILCFELKCGTIIKNYIVTLDVTVDLSQWVL